MKTRAAQVRCPMAGVDLVGEMTHGPWAGQTYGGSSFVADGTGKILLTLKDRDTDFRVIDVQGRIAGAMREIKGLLNEHGGSRGFERNPPRSNGAELEPALLAFLGASSRELPGGAIAHLARELDAVAVYFAAVVDRDVVAVES